MTYFQQFMEVLRAWFPDHKFYQGEMQRPGPLYFSKAMDPEEWPGNSVALEIWRAAEAKGRLSELLERAVRGEHIKLEDYQ